MQQMEKMLKWHAPHTVLQAMTAQYLRLNVGSQSVCFWAHCNLQFGIFAYAPHYSCVACNAGTERGGKQGTGGAASALSGRWFCSGCFERQHFCIPVLPGGCGHGAAQGAIIQQYSDMQVYVWMTHHSTQCVQFWKSFTCPEKPICSQIDGGKFD